MLNVLTKVEFVWTDLSLIFILFMQWLTFVPSQNDCFASGTVDVHRVNSVAVVTQVEEAKSVSALI